MRKSGRTKREVRKMTETNIGDHCQTEKFYQIMQYGLKSGGIHVVASKGHGKSRLMFSMARTLQNFCKVYIFDGSETWLYAYDKIPTFTVEDNTIRLVSDNHTTEDIERYKIENWNLVELALQKYPSLLFRLKTRKPSKRGFFVRTVVNHLDTIQRCSRETTADNEAKQYIAYFIEEAQDCFNSKATTRLEAEEFLTVFNEARNQREAFFTASQRLTDFSKTIRTKQLYCIGRINEEDKSTSLRHIEKLHNLDFNCTAQRTWFLEGLKTVFTSPEWRQKGKPFQINKEVKKAFLSLFQQQKPKKNTLSKIGAFIEKVLDWPFSKKKQYGYDDTKEDLWSEGQSDYHDYPSDEDDEDEEFMFG